MPAEDWRPYAWPRRCLRRGTACSRRSREGQWWHRSCRTATKCNNFLDNVGRASSSSSHQSMHCFEFVVRYTARHARSGCDCGLLHGLTRSWHWPPARWRLIDGVASSASKLNCDKLQGGLCHWYHESWLWSLVMSLYDITVPWFCLRLSVWGWCLSVLSWPRGEQTAKRVHWSISSLSWQVQANRYRTSKYSPGEVHWVPGRRPWWGRIGGWGWRRVIIKQNFSSAKSLQEALMRGKSWFHRCAPHTIALTAVRW